MKITEAMLSSFNGSNGTVPYAQNPEVIRKAKAGNKDAINMIIDENEGLISDIALFYLNKIPVKVDMDDLMQAGKMGFMEAIERYDQSKGAKLTTYATYWIKAFIQEEIEIARTIRIPLRGLDSKQGQRVRRVSSINTDNRSNGLSKSELLPSNEEGLIDTVTRNDFQEEFHKKITHLVEEQIITEREKEILFMRFGINQAQALTLEEIGERFNPPIPINEIEQIINEVINKLRLHLYKLESNESPPNQAQSVENNVAIAKNTSPVLIMLTTNGQETTEKEIEAAFSYIATRNDLKDVLDNTLHDLIKERKITEKQKQILYMCFGINQPERFTLEQIGNKFNPPLLKKAVYRYKNAAIKKLKAVIFKSDSPIYRALKKIKEELLQRTTELRESETITEKESQVLTLYFQSWFELEKPTTYRQLGKLLNPTTTGEAVRQNMDRGMKKLIENFET